MAFSGIGAYGLPATAQFKVNSQIMTRQPPFSHQHATHHETLWKFIGLLSLLIGYFFYLSHQYGAADGLWVALLTWSFFVLCTPVADGGFILAFPVRLLFKVKMLTTQIITWLLAIALNVLALHYLPEHYEKTAATHILKTILLHPYPYWGLLVISAMGTFLSIYFGDEMLDVTHHKDRHKHHKHGLKYRLLLLIGLGALTVLLYQQLLSELHLNIPD